MYVGFKFRLGPLARKADPSSSYIDYIFVVTLVSATRVYYRYFGGITDVSHEIAQEYLSGGWWIKVDTKQDTLKLIKKYREENTRV